MIVITLENLSYLKIWHWQSCICSNSKR